MKRQQFKLKVVDHRKGSEEIETFDNDRDFLKAVGRVANTSGAHVSEQTVSVIHLYGKDQTALFKNPKQQTDE
jgi:hypothetical protein